MTHPVSPHRHNGHPFTPMACTRNMSRRPHACQPWDIHKGIGLARPTEGRRPSETASVDVHGRGDPCAACFRRILSTIHTAHGVLPNITCYPLRTDTFIHTHIRGMTAHAIMHPSLLTRPKPLSPSPSLFSPSRDLGGRRDSSGQRRSHKRDKPQTPRDA